MVNMSETDTVNDITTRNMSRIWRRIQKWKNIQGIPFRLIRGTHIFLFLHFLIKKVSGYC